MGNKSAILILIILLWSSVAVAYDDKTTHPALTQRAILSSNLDKYLPQNFGFLFPKGTDSTIGGNKIADLIIQGSKDEDAIICRRSTHFHNPLMAWDQAGMNEVLMNPWCPSYQQPGSFGKYSALVWATGYETKSGPINSNRGSSRPGAASSGGHGRTRVYEE